MQADFAEAQSVSFFEARLFLRGTFEQPIDLLDRVKCLNSSKGRVPTWVVQGTGDEVCPEVFAQQLVTALEVRTLAEWWLDGCHWWLSEGWWLDERVAVN